MASITTVNVGTTDDDGTGATLRAGGQVINANFTAINTEVVQATTDIAALGDLADLNTVGTSEIDDDAVTLAKIQDIATASIIGRSTGGTGIAEVLSAASTRTLLNVEDGSTADQTDLEIETAYNNQVSTVDQSTAEAGVSTTVFRWTPQRVSQAIAALGSDLFTIFGQTADFDISSFTDQSGAPSLSSELLIQRPDTSYRSLTLTLLEQTLSVDDLKTLSGVSSGAVNLGTFSGSTFTDNSTIKAVLQEAETAIEGLDDADIAAASSATNYTPGSSTVDGHLSGIDTALGDASSLPVDDTTFIAKDPADATKRVRFDLDQALTSTDIVLTLDESVDFTDILTGTSGQKLGFDATPETAVYSDRHAASLNLYDATKPASFTTVFDGTVVACTGETDTGTVNIAVDIAGTNVTGLTAVALDSTISGNRDTSTAANTYTKGQLVTVTPSGASGSPTHITVVVELLQTSLPGTLS